MTLLHYRTPGVYFETSDVRSPSIDRVRTDIAGFVGITTRGPLHRPVKIESWEQFTSLFGAYNSQGYLAYAVEGFFENGGQTCWVVRVADPIKVQSARIDLRDAFGKKVLRLLASSPGSWGNSVRLRAIITGPEHFNLFVQPASAPQEVWRNLCLNPNDQRFAIKILNDEQSGSIWVRACSPISDGTPSLGLFSQGDVSGRLQGGKDGLSTLRPDHFDGRGTVLNGPCQDQVSLNQPWGLRTLKKIDEVGMIAMPDIMPKFPQPSAKIKKRFHCNVLNPDPAAPVMPATPGTLPPVFSEAQIEALQSAMIIHCETLKDRVAVLDYPPSAITQELPLIQLLNWRRNFDSSYASLYYPWIRISDPLQSQGNPRKIPPSGHVMGIYASTDHRTGVHKAPANEVVSGALEVTVNANELRHGELNKEGINVIRTIPGRRVRLLGARTLCRQSALRFINVRRLLIMIAESIDQATQWMVFEPNSPQLWREVDRVARSFLKSLWRGGQLDGETEEQAYFVRCDESTNPPQETDQGRLICLIGVNPPWPAEFIIVRLGKTESGITIEETSEVTHA